MSHVDKGTLHAYLDGELSEGQRREVEEHLAACAECQARLEQATALGQRASELMAELEPGPVQAPAWREIEARATARRARTPQRSWIRPSLAWAASIAVAFAVGWFSRSYWSAMPGPLDVARTAEAPAAAARPTAPEEETPGRGARQDAPAPASAVVEAEEVPPEAQQVTVQVEEPEAPTPQSPGERGEPTVAPKQTERPTDTPVRDVPVPPEAGEVPAEALAETPVEEPAVVGALEARAREQQEHEQPADVLDQLRREAETVHAYAPDVVGLQPTAAGAAAATRFFVVQPEVASTWLGTPLRRLLNLQLKHVEVGPGSAVEGGIAGLPAVQLVYEDAAGQEIILIQQYLGDRRIEGAEAEPTLIVEPSGLRAYRWLDPQGYWLILRAALSSDSLRALAEQVR